MLSFRSPPSPWKKVAVQVSSSLRLDLISSCRALLLPLCQPPAVRGFSPCRGHGFWYFPPQAPLQFSHHLKSALTAAAEILAEQEVDMNVLHPPHRSLLVSCFRSFKWPISLHHPFVNLHVRHLLSHFLPLHLSSTTFSSLSFSTMVAHIFPPSSDNMQKALSIPRVGSRAVTGGLNFPRRSRLLREVSRQEGDN